MGSYTDFFEKQAAEIFETEDYIEECRRIDPASVPQLRPGVGCVHCGAWLCGEDRRCG